MIKTSDGGFLVTSFASNAQTSANDMMLVKFSSSAAIEWVGIYGAAQNEEPHAVT